MLKASKALKCPRGDGCSAQCPLLVEARRPEFAELVSKGPGGICGSFSQDREQAWSPGMWTREESQAQSAALPSEELGLQASSYRTL